MNIRLLLNKLYPENSTQGECGIFAHRLIDFSQVGNTYASKKRAVDSSGIPAVNLQQNFHIGDVVITDEGTFMGMGAGHVGVVNFIDDNFVYLSESNFNKDGKVHHTRKLPKNSSKIYGVLRGKPQFKVPTVPMTLKTTVFLNYEHQMDLGALFEPIKKWFSEASGGKVNLEIHPVYSHGAIKNWWYAGYLTGQGSEAIITIHPTFFKDNVMPVRFPDSKIVLLAINKKEWQGTTFVGGAGEIGWYYPQTNPIQCLLSADESDQSPVNFGWSLFADAMRHEIIHGLYALGRFDGQDWCHNRFFGQNGYAKDFNKVFDDFDYEYLTMQL